MPKAVKVTKDNVDRLIAFGRFCNMDLSYLTDQIDCYADFGWETYLITDGHEVTNNRTFTAMGSADFRGTWKFKSQEWPNQFVEIERV